MKIKVTDFAKRHFEKKFGGTKILDYTFEEFEKKLEFIKNKNYSSDSLIGEYGTNIGKMFIYKGYAPFCKLVAIPNFTNARVGSLPIALENYPFIRSGYSARTESELPVFSRWLELPLPAPKAEWLILVLYDKEQIDKEGRITEGEGKNPNEKYVPLDADYGIVAILGQTHPNEEPMKPETMIRNALGINEGGSGVPLNRKKYLESVEFWSNNITVK